MRCQYVACAPDIHFRSVSRRDVTLPLLVVLMLRILVTLRRQQQSDSSCSWTVLWWYRCSNLLVAIISADFGSFLSNSLNKICILPPTCATDNLTCNCTIRVRRCHVSRFWKKKQAIELEFYSTYGGLLWLTMVSVFKWCHASAVAYISS